MRKFTQEADFMLKSMPSFGRSRQTLGGKDITVEIKSVNNRYFDCQTKLPRVYSHLEQKVKPYLQERGISRGKVDVFISVEFTESADTEITVNTECAANYIAALKKLKENFGLSGEISVMDVARAPDVLTFTKKDDDERDWEDLEIVLRAAADAFMNARVAEGQRIKADLAGKAAHIQDVVKKIKDLSESDINGYKSKLEEKLRAVLADNNVTVDENRILTECAIYADKAAIDEELVRLNSHFVAFYNYLEAIEPVGRSLDFLLQEMNREINTVGSKCANADIARLVVEVKTELEKIREQIQNIE